MDDLERYSDYNEYEDDRPRGKSKVGLILKLTIAAVCLSVVGVLIFRVVLFNTYPKSMKNIYFNDTLTAYYNATEGNIGAITQGLRAEYDDPDEGNFFCDNLIVIPGANQVQISVRYNTSLMAAIEEKYKVSLDPDSTDNFTFSLSALPMSKNDGTAFATGTLSVMEFDERLMYRYYKLVFDGVDSEYLNISDNEYYWIRLEIRIKGVEMKSPYMVLIYEDVEGAKFSDYTLSSKEKPNG